MVADPGKEPLPFVETDEETSGPATLVGNDRVAFMIGSGDTRRIAIASLRDGRIIKRLEDVKAATIRSIIASRDGKTFYFVDSGDVWSIPVDGGSPQKIHNGDGVAITPDGNNLIIQLIEAERIRWLKVTLDGRNEQPIPVKGDAHFTFAPIGPGAVGRDGRIVLPLTVKDSWFWVPAIFDPNTGIVQRIPVPLQADPPSPAWTNDGKIIVAAYSMDSSLWRFRPQK